MCYAINLIVVIYIIVKRMDFLQELMELNNECLIRELFPENYKEINKTYNHPNYKLCILSKKDYIQFYHKKNERLNERLNQQINNLPKSR
tara:strand:+ start:308 stop:577 length:270 start_codon:yes stop_codon:yes gene_type:complete